MRTKLFIITVTAVFFGIVTGYLGSAVDHYNHSRVGTSYSQWHGEWLCLPSLPGALLAEFQSGYDWGADEQWLHRHSVAVWNALFWLVASAVCTAPFLLRSLPRHSMTRTLIAFSLSVVIVGCGRSNTSSSMSSKSEIVTVQSEDAEMNAAMRIARDRFLEFWREVSADYKRVIPALGVSMVKAYFYDPSGSPLGGEHMWVSSVEYDGKTITGELEDTPRHLRSVRTGQQVSFPLERLSDWFYVDGDKAVGAFKVKLLRIRMSEEERRAHDSHYPFRFE